MPVQLPMVKEPRRGEPLVAKTLRVGDLAKRTGKTVRALHLYEERGLLEPVERTKGGYRLYAEESVTRVRWITKMQQMGFSLTELGAMVEEWEQSGSASLAMQRVEALLRDKLADTRDQIARLQALERELVSSLDYLEACPSCDPARILEACSRCELHASDQEAPDLVAGFHAQ